MHWAYHNSDPLSRASLTYDRMSFKGVLDLRGALLQPLKSRQHTLRQLFRNEKAIQTTILIESARHWSKDKSDKVNYFQLLNLILTGLHCRFFFSYDWTALRAKSGLITSGLEIGS